jgi:hypothetical protein
VEPRAGGEEKNSQALPGLETPIIQPVAQRYTTELSQLPMAVFVYVITHLLTSIFVHSLK